MIRNKIGTIMGSTEQRLFPAKFFAHHLEQIKSTFDAGLLDGVIIENMGQTSFIVNMDKSHTLGFKCDTKLNYMGFVSGGQRITLDLRIYGRSGSKIEFVFVIFSNKIRSFSIQSVPDTL